MTAASGFLDRLDQAIAKNDSLLCVGLDPEVERLPEYTEPPTTEPHVERPGPTEFRDPFVRREMQKAAVWFGMALAIIGVVVLGQPLLLIVGGAIFAVFLDGAQLITVADNTAPYTSGSIIVDQWTDALIAQIHVMRGAINAWMDAPIAASTTSATKRRAPLSIKQPTL